jgi:hypothetical protein
MELVGLGIAASLQVWFRPVIELLDSAVSPCWASPFFLFGQEKVTKKKATPTSGFCFAKTSLTPALLQGSD